MIRLVLIACLLALLPGFYVWYRLSGLAPYYSAHKILMLHGVAGHFDFSISNLSKPKINAVLDRSRELGFEFKPLADLFNKTNNHASGKSIYLTFDDGYEELYELFYEVLEPRNIPMAIFMTAGFIGQSADWDYKPKKARHLSLEQARKLSSHTLVTFGSHSLTHPDLTLISREKMLVEIAESKHLLEDILACKIEYFSYPFGRFHADVAGEVQKAGYKAAFCGVPVSTMAGNNLFALPRIPLNLLDNLYTFNAKIQSGPLSWMEYSKARVIELFSGLTHHVRRNS